MKVGILQPGYIPWLGFFEQVSRCDVFVYLDDVQYIKNDWRNRNRIKTKDGIQWLTVPVSYKFGQKINEVRINKSYQWSKKHINALKTWYGKSKFFEVYDEEIERILRKEWTYLVDLDIEFTGWFVEKLGIRAKTVLSSEISVKNIKDKQQRLIEICKTLGCNYFYEGCSGQNYVDTELFSASGITVEFQDFHHPYYNQLWQEEQGFISHLSIVDLLFNYGNESLAIITGEKVIACPGNVEIKNANEDSVTGDDLCLT